MKAAKLLVITILMAFSLALTGAASEVSFAKQLAGKQKNQSFPANQTTNDDGRKVLRKVEDNEFTWKSQDRTLNDEPQPS